MHEDVILRKGEPDMGVSNESFERDAKAVELIRALQRDGAVIVRERTDNYSKLLLRTSVS